MSDASVETIVEWLHECEKETMCFPIAGNTAVGSRGSFAAQASRAGRWAASIHFPQLFRTSPDSGTRFVSRVARPTTSVGCCFGPFGAGGETSGLQGGRMIRGSVFGF